jgi:hypothetical protein
MWMDAQEALAQRDEACSEKDRVWRELIQLHTINKQEPRKEFVGGKR